MEVAALGLFSTCKRRGANASAGCRACLPSRHLGGTIRCSASAGLPTTLARLACPMLVMLAPLAPSAVPPAKGKHSQWLGEMLRRGDAELAAAPAALTATEQAHHPCDHSLVFTEPEDVALSLTISSSVSALLPEAEAEAPAMISLVAPSMLPPPAAPAAGQGWRGNGMTG